MSSSLLKIPEVVGDNLLHIIEALEYIKVLIIAALCLRECTSPCPRIRMIAVSQEHEEYYISILEKQVKQPLFV